MTHSAPTVFIGPLPLPVHGQSVATEILRDRLVADGLTLRVIDINGGSGIKSIQLLRRIFRMVRAAMTVALSRKSRAYISVNANRGMAVTSITALIARLRGHDIVLHHHTRSHLEPGHPRMRTLVRAAGNEALHIGICASMCMDIQRAAGKDIRTLAFSNIGAVNLALRKMALTVANPLGSLTIGHMSNLTLEKGLERVVDSFRAAKQQGLAHRLMIAGPAGDEDARRVINATQAEFGSDFHWVGPIYGAEKLKFFQEIDVFLFPSLYPNETQGIVNLEALAAGVPVLAYDICCTSSDLRGPAAATVSPDRPFALAACNFLKQLSDAAPIQARQRFDKLLADHKAEYIALRSTLEP